MTAAPLLPREPATTRTWPYKPLCESTERTRGKSANSWGSTHRKLLLPISSTSAPGEPMATTSSAPTAAQSLEINWPGLGAVKVTVRCAYRAGPSAAGPSDGRPEGVSTARTRDGCAAVDRCEC